MKMEKSTGTYLETIEFTHAQAKAWPLPIEVQRGLTVNQKVLDVAEVIKNDGGVIPGVITFCVLDRINYLTDGQQRREAFLLSGKEIGYVDARFVKCATMADVGEEFVKLNGHLVGMTPDDFLRPLTLSLPPLQHLKNECNFIGYDNIRRNENTPLMSMSVTIRSWAKATTDVPGGGGSKSAEVLARQLTMEEAKHLADFMNLAFKAWGRDVEYYRLWGAVNLVLCMWLYRRLVISPYSPKTPRLSNEQFTRCLMGLSADDLYIDFLQGRHLGHRDRAPAYGRIKTLFAKRLNESANGKKISLPAPEWSRGTKMR